MTVAEAILPSAGQLYVGGRWRLPSTGEMRPVLNPATGEAFAEAGEASWEDCNAALAPAKEAYGLSAYLFTRDLSTAMKVARDLDFGELYITKVGPEQLQGYHTGFRESGIGGDDGKQGLEGFLKKKTVYLNYASSTEA